MYDVTGDDILGDGDLAVMGDFAGDDFAGDDFAGDDFAGDDAAGEEQLMGAAEDIMGARGRRIMRKVLNRAKSAARVAVNPAGAIMRAAQGAPVRAALPSKRPGMYNPVPGASPPAVGRIPLGFGLLTCSVAAGNTTGGTLTARPQVPWRGSKLIITITGANNDNYSVTLRPTIGNRPVLAGAADTDARAYSATALGNELMAEGAGPGIDVTLQFTVAPAVTGTDVVMIQATWIGDAVV